MSNRKKPRNRRLIRRKAINDHLEKAVKVDIPMQEKTVLKTVPAMLHWSQVDSSPRTDSEEIGKAVIYEDGTQDVIIFDNISDDAKLFLNPARQMLSRYSLEED